MNFPQRLNGRLVLKKREIRSKRGRLGRKEGDLGGIFDTCKTLSKRILTTVFKLADTFTSIRYKLNNR